MTSSVNILFVLAGVFLAAILLNMCMLREGFWGSTVDVDSTNAAMAAAVFGRVRPGTSLEGRATLEQVKEFRIKVYDEIKRLSASGTSDPVITAHIKKLTTMQSFIDEVIAQRLAGAISKNSMPIYTSDIEKSLLDFGGDISREASSNIGNASKKYTSGFEPKNPQSWPNPPACTLGNPEAAAICKDLTSYCNSNPKDINCSSIWDNGGKNSGGYQGIARFCQEKPSPFCTAAQRWSQPDASSNMDVGTYGNSNTNDSPSLEQGETFSQLIKQLVSGISQSKKDVSATEVLKKPHDITPDSQNNDILNYSLDTSAQQPTSITSTNPVAEPKTPSLRQGADYSLEKANSACAVAQQEARNANPCPVDSNDYIRKDSIPCYGCNIK